MSEFVKVNKEELECLRRHLSEATRLLKVLQVGEPIAPEPTPKPEKKISLRQQRVNKYLKKLENRQ